MKMKGLLLVLLLSSRAALTQSIVELTIDDAVRIGMERSKTLEITRRVQDAARSKSEEADAARLPSLKLQAGYQRLSDVDPFRVIVPFAPEPITISPIVLNSYTLRLSVQQPLFTGFKLKSVAEAADDGAEASRFDVESERADLVVRITSAYWLLYQSNEVKKYLDENVRRMDAYERDADLLMKAGLGTRNDLLRIQVQHSNARLSQIDAAHDVRLAMMSLNNVMGAPLQTEITLLSVPVEGDVDPLLAPGGELELHGLMGYAMSNRPDLQSLELQVKAGDANVTAAKGAWWPQVSFLGNYYFNRPNLRYLPTRDEFKDTWDVGVNLSFDIWNWGLTARQVEQAESHRAKLELHYMQKRDNIAIEITNAYQQVLKAQEKVGVARLAVSQAGENARSIEEKHRNGLATSSELLDANVALLQTLTNQTSALVELEVSRALLRRAAGSSAQSAADGEHEKDPR